MNNYDDGERDSCRETLCPRALYRSSKLRIDARVVAHEQYYLLSLCRASSNERTITPYL